MYLTPNMFNKVSSSDLLYEIAIYIGHWHTISIYFVFPFKLILAKNGSQE